MPTISQIPEFVNRYAIDCAYQIRAASIEYGKGLDYSGNKIVRESELVQGKLSSLYYDFNNGPKDIFVHNHPKGASLNFTDIALAMQKKVKKIYASTKEGFTAMDFTTMDKSIDIGYLNLWAIAAKGDSQKYLDKSMKEIREANSIFVPFKDFLSRKLEQFVKISGATFEKVKWEDYMQNRKATNANS